jgi:hypothetical protein
MIIYQSIFLTSLIPITSHRSSFTSLYYKEYQHRLIRAMLTTFSCHQLHLGVDTSTSPYPPLLHRIGSLASVFGIDLIRGLFSSRRIEVCGRNGTGRGDQRLCVYYDPTKKDLQTYLGRRCEELGDVTFMLCIKI